MATWWRQLLQRTNGCAPTGSPASGCPAPGLTLSTPDAWRPALLSAITEDGMALLRARAAATLRGSGGRASTGTVGILCGERGSGRRTAAEILAGQLGCDLHRVDAGALGEDRSERR